MKNKKSIFYFTLSSINFIPAEITFDCVDAKILMFKFFKQCKNLEKMLKLLY